MVLDWLFKQKKENSKEVSFTPIPGNHCPKCGEILRNVTGVPDISVWCINCGWRQIDYSLNKPSIFS